MNDLVEASNTGTGQRGADERGLVSIQSPGKKVAPIEAGDKARADFDPVAVGDKIAGHIAAADQAKDRMAEHSRAAGALLLDVATNHREHLKAICDRINLGLSRRKELLAIAAGRKTVEQSRADNTARQHRHREKKRTPGTPKAKPLQGGVTAVREAEGNVGPDASANAMKVSVEAEARPRLVETRESTTPESEIAGKLKAKGKRLPSDRALAEFKFAAGQYLPDMSLDDRRKALECVRGHIERLAQLEQPEQQAA